MTLRRNFEAEEAEAESDQFRSTAWAVNLADLMTFLMIFFLLMFSFYFSMAQNPEYKSRFEKSIKSIEQQFSKKDFKAAGVTMVQPKDVKPHIQSEDEKSMINIKTITLKKEMYFLYSGELSSKDTREIIKKAYLASRRDSSSIVNADVPELELAEDEVAAYVVTQISIPANIIKGKMTVKRHKVKPGESLWKICSKYGLDPKKFVRQIARDNKLKHPSIIRSGKPLEIKVYPFPLSN
ncbi:MAG: LysM peptidoglycan-binding domain-containing protein [Candidatus Margulisiibacteriota bacterium]